MIGGTSIQPESAEWSPGTVAADGHASNTSSKNAKGRVRRPLTVTPVRSDSRLETDRRLPGVSSSFTHGGITLELTAGTEDLSDSLLLGLKSLDGRCRYTGVQVGHVARLSESRLRVDARIGGPVRDFLLAENLTPRFDPRALRFHDAVSPAVARSWTDAKVLRPTVCDRVQLCPKCHTLPTFRRACRVCQSARVTNERLVHHYACAHVGSVSEFESGDELICPKCHTRKLVVNADFEYVRGPYRCDDCDWTDMELERVGHCLRCGFRFPEHHAFEKELVTYHVDRLDPLAFVATSG